MNDLLIPALIMGGIALVLAVLLSIASTAFAVKKDPKEEAILAVLPGANCGACGYPGCGQYAKAVVEGDATNKCTVGGAPIAESVSEIMGVEATAAVEKIAHVNCKGGTDCTDDFVYIGLQTCKAQTLVSGGAKSCKQGCLGCGDCVEVCNYDAIFINDKNRAEVIADKCVGCMACVKECPKGIITMVPKPQKTIVECMNTQKGAVIRKLCVNSCIACKICEKTCPVDAIHVINNVAVIDYDKCIDCTACARKCPTGAIRLVEKKKVAVAS